MKQEEDGEKPPGYFFYSFFFDIKSAHKTLLLSLPSLSYLISHALNLHVLWKIPSSVLNQNR